MRNLIMRAFKFIFLSTVFVFKLIFALLNYTVISFYKVFLFFFAKLRFSIAFKINFLYGFIYLILLLLTHLVSIGVILSFLEKNAIDFSQLPIYLLLILCASLILSFIIFLVIGRLVVKKMLRPLKVMTHTVQTIKANELSERLDASGAKDELKDLAVTFNELMDRVKLFVESQKQFVSDASHELRTPIAVIEGYAAMLDRWGKEDPQILEESLHSIKSETQSMKHLVEKLLFLARSDRDALKVVKEQINLSTLTKEVIKETSFIDDEHEFICRADENVMILGDSYLIKELIRILVDNAIKYTPEGGTITLHSIYTSKSVLLSIKDTGIGISSAHIPHLFERFYRTAEARDKNSGGTGLGLSIAKWIADTHSAAINVSSYEGEGTDFLVFFPLISSGQ